MTHHDTVVAAVPRRTYANAHAYHINSISVNSDGETFISSDDLRINLWNLNIQDQSFNIVDIKPANMEELTEVITAAEFHPQSCNWFMYASSKGTIKLADMRESALCDQHAKRMSSISKPPFLANQASRIRARRRPFIPLILLRNHLLHLRCPIFPRRSIHSLS
jgi:serine/threonine-protein phosphatase 2A regulatory subunit B